LSDQTEVASVRSRQPLSARRTAGSGRAAVLLLAASLSACGTLNSVKDTLLGGSSAGGGPVRLDGFIGAAVADEPRAALAAREVLALGGNAADAAVALGFTLAVTLPSRAGLGGGGGCLAYNPSRDGPGGGSPEAVAFVSPAPATPNGPADRPAAVPMLARGLFALHAKYGSRPFESLVAPAEQLARFGVPVSRALLQDLAVVAGPLAQDPNARAVFAPGGQPLREGGTLAQPDLGATLATLRTAGVGDLYQGALARKLEDGSRLAGGGMTVGDLRAALPRIGAPLVVRAGRDSAAFLPGDGGQQAAAAFAVLQENPGNVQGAQAAAPRGGSLPASTGFAVLDRNGNSVVCALTMNNLFGTGRIAPGTGILLAASPRAGPAPLLAAALAWNASVRGFRAAVTGSGQEGAALAAALALSNTLRAGTAMPAAVPEPGRANVIACARYLPGNEGACSAAADPRGAGLAAGSN
jgi:gamma-glutamyltranspeptidase/glutathione hydrolase